MKNTIIIAEIGECFNGDLEIAKKLILAAKNAGCDFAKFQTLDYDNISDEDPERDWFKKIALDPKKMNFLTRFAKEHRMQILFAPENIKTAIWLADSGHRHVKIASNTIVDKEMIRFINKKFDCVFMSTGMASLDEIDKTVCCLQDVKELSIMHCISEYPTGPLLEQRGLVALQHENVKLNMMQILMGIYPHFKIGYSDHTAGILAPLAAVSMGAKVIEKHITFDRETPIKNSREGKEYLGTDHILSIEPDDLKKMVIQIREIEKMFGHWKWERTEGEKVLMDFMRVRFAEK